MAESKKERTIRSETTKVFLVIFIILASVGIFTIVSALKGSQTFSTIREVHLKQFRAAELMKQRALDVIAIYYLLATDQDMELLMTELKRYDGLVQNFEESSKALEASYGKESGPEKTKVINLLNQIKKTFDDLNNSCRRMTFAMMEGKKKESAAELPGINAGIGKFKSQLDSVESIVENQLDTEATRAQALLKKTTWIGVGITALAIFITLGLISYLMKFLSVSLLPISNLMHNMRQAVFSIDKNLNVISPVSRYSNVVFGEEIVGKNVNDIIYSEVDKKTEAYASNKSALNVVFGEDDLQWMLQEDALLGKVKRTVTTNGSSQEKILKLTYTPLMEKGIVQNIMIVAEDATEVEKLRAESLKQQGEMEVIKGVIGMDLVDLEVFLTSSKEQVSEAFTLQSTLETDKASRQSLFRILHTLKGNSRMYKLNAISEVVHVVENSIVEINLQLDAGDKLTEEQKADLRKGLDNIENIFAEHSKMARKLFGLVDVFSDRGEEQSKESKKEEQKVEILASTFKEIETLAKELSQARDDKKVKQLNDVIGHAFDLPIQSLCRKMEPMINEISGRMGKNIHFQITGEDIALDRDRAFAMRDALVHIIRNSLDHGIEAPEERVVNGKPPKALLEIATQRKDNQIEILVRDDGRGIDVEKLIKKAISMGSLTEDDSKKLSWDESLELIFLPNLSTKDEVTNLSGRGVGMDAVKTTVEKLGGSIKLYSTKNNGTQIKMFLTQV